MSRLALLLLLAAGLAAVVLAELAVTPDLPSAGVARLATPVPIRTEAAADRPAAWTAESLARPLFSPDRRPPAAAAAASGTPGVPRLAGTLISPDGRRAIFARGDDGGARPVTVAEGATVDGYLVQSIAAGQVTLAGAGGVHVLHPAFDPNRPVVAAPVLPLPQPAPPPLPRSARPGSTP